MFKTLSLLPPVLLAWLTTGCSSFITVPDQHGIVSNHRAVIQVEDDYCVPASENRPLYATSTDTALDPAGFNLLNWNVLKETRPDWQADFSRLSRNRDIVALQEAQLQYAFQQGLEQKNLYWDITSAFYMGGRETGVLTASRVRPGATCFIYEDEPLIRVPKSALITEYRLKGSEKSLLVANVHMINFSTGMRSYINQLDDVVNRLRNHQGPIIVTGDFNTWNNTRKRVVDAMASELGLTAVEFKADHRMKIFGATLDHIYYRGLELTSASTEEVETSDHNPMLASFRVASNY